ncbi:hypothetical protein [Celeribacter indicus]|uniref:hypothetical protein n=1 Tax=Celeribacter indicus TaxID=1208324 RepID=UPI000AD3D5D5|nr:hypothetical protein [Celeribacter indicus]
MDKKPDPSRKAAKAAAGGREARLKAALKANLQRRKAQARARQAAGESGKEDE